MRAGVTRCIISGMTGSNAMTALLLLLSVSGAACERAPEPPEYVPPIQWDTGTVRIYTATDTFVLSVEIAERADQRAYGLMERPTLPEDAGMIFLYPGEQAGQVGFWMFRTRIPLDIAFLDADGVILTILAMEPCPSPEPRSCPSYPPNVPYRAALEVNQGYFARRGIGVGDRVVLERP
jgi:uncharacterized protein